MKLAEQSLAEGLHPRLIAEAWLGNSLLPFATICILPSVFPALETPWQGFEIAREETVKFLDTFKAPDIVSLLFRYLSHQDILRHTETANANDHVEGQLRE